MKKLFSLILLATLFVSCSSDDNDDPVTDNESYKVIFNVSTISQSFEELERSSNAIQSLDGIKTVVCVIFDNKGNFYKSIISKEADTNFGKLEIELPTNNYKICVIATDMQDARPDVGNGTTISTFTNNNVGGEYIKTLEINVSKPTEQNLVLDRVIGKLELIATDIVPADYNIVYMDIYMDKLSGLYYPFAGGVKEFTSLSGGDRVNLDNYRGQSNLTVFQRTDYGGENRKATITIVFKDRNEGVIATKEVKDVEIYKNKKTILKGAIFDSFTTGDNTLGVNMELQANWDSDVVVNF